MLKLCLADDCCEAIQVQLAMMSSSYRLCFHAYNDSNQLVSSNKSMFVENPNTRKVKRVGMVDMHWINGMETQGFPSTKKPTLFCGTGPAAW